MYFYTSLISLNNNIVFHFAVSKYDEPVVKIYIILCAKYSQTCILRGYLWDKEIVALYVR
jgi:hypothetical protein